MNIIKPWFPGNTNMFKAMVSIAFLAHRVPVPIFAWEESRMMGKRISIAARIKTDLSPRVVQEKV